MKKFFVLFLALTFVLSMAAFAVADDAGQGNITGGGTVDISGDARVRGVWNDDDTAADNRYWDQRVRLKITGNVGSGIEVRTRLVAADGTWDGAANTGGSSRTQCSQTTVDGVLQTDSNGGPVMECNDGVYIDYMYLHIPVAGLVVDAGRMKRNWGNKFYIWDVARDTFQLTTNVGDVQLGLFTDKVNETTNTTTGSQNLDDFDNYGIFANFSADNLTAGLIVVREEDNRAEADLAGGEASAYLNASVGAIGIAAEIAYQKGSTNDDTAGKHPRAGFISASTDVGAIGVSAAFCVAQNGYVADSHFTPSVFFGTDNPTAVADFQAAADSTSTAIAVGASTDVTSDLSARTTLLWADLENLGEELGGADTANEEVFEIDLGLTYKLADNATYKVDFGYLFANNLDNVTGDDAMALAHKIEVSF